MKFVKITFDRFKIDCTKSFGIAITKKRRTITSNTRRAYKYWWMRSFETIAILIENVPTTRKACGGRREWKKFSSLFCTPRDRSYRSRRIDRYVPSSPRHRRVLKLNWNRQWKGQTDNSRSLNREHVLSLLIYINVTAVTNLRNHDTRSFVSRPSSSQQGTKHSNIFYYPIADRFDPILSSTRLTTRLTLVRF